MLRPIRLQSVPGASQIQFTGVDGAQQESFEFSDHTQAIIRQTYSEDSGSSSTVPSSKPSRQILQKSHTPLKY